MLILFYFCFFTCFIRHSTSIPSDHKYCFDFFEKWFLSSPCYAAFVLSNAFSSQEFVKGLGGGLNLSSILKPFHFLCLSVKYTAQRWLLGFFGNMYKTRESPCSDLSSLRFSPYFLVLQGYIYWSFWSRSSDCLKL